MFFPLLNLLLACRAQLLREQSKKHVNSLRINVLLVVGKPKLQSNPTVTVFPTAIFLYIPCSFYRHMPH